MADRTQKSWKGEKREQVISEGKVCVCVRGLGWGVGGRGWGRKCKQEKEELANRGDSQQGLVKCDGERNIISIGNFTGLSYGTGTALSIMRYYYNSHFTEEEAERQQS